MAQHTITTNVASGNVTVPGGAAITASGIAELDDSTIPSSNDNQIGIAFPYATLKSFAVVSSVNMTLEFNNSTTGVPTIVLVANIPYYWRSDSGITNPFTADVTKCYTSQSSGAVARLRMSALYDATP